MAKKTAMPGYMTYLREWELLMKLDNETLGRFIKAMGEYVFFGIEPSFNGLEEVAFERFRESLDRDVENYNKCVEARREAGIKSGEARRKKAEAARAAAQYEPDRYEAEEMPFDGETVSFEQQENPIDSSTVEEKPVAKRRGRPPKKAAADADSMPYREVPPPVQPLEVVQGAGITSGERGCERFPPTLEMVAEYVKLRGLQVDIQQFLSVQEANGWKDSNGNPIRNWRTWLEGWVQRHPIKNQTTWNGRVPSALNYEQRTYQEGELNHVYTDLTPYMGKRRNPAAIQQHHYEEGELDYLFDRMNKYDAEEDECEVVVQ